MQDLVMSLSKASVKLALDGWDRELEIDFKDDNYTIITGRNAGGKTLALKCLADFCDFLREPSNSKFDRLVSFFKQVKTSWKPDGGENRILDSIQTQYEYEWLDYKSNSKLPLVDSTLIKWFKLENDDANFDETPKIDLPTLASRLLVDEENLKSGGLLIKASVLVQNRLTFVPSGVHSELDYYRLERRDGVRFNLTSSFTDIDGELASISPAPAVVFDEWREVTYSEEPLHSFGPWDHRGHRWMDEIEQRLGLIFDRDALEEAADRTYDFHKTDKMLRFQISPVDQRSVSEAYRLSSSMKKEVGDTVASWDDWYFEHLGNVFRQEFERELKSLEDDKFALAISNVITKRTFEEENCNCDAQTRDITMDFEEGKTFEETTTNFACRACGETLKLKLEDRLSPLVRFLSNVGLVDKESQFQLRDVNHFNEIFALWMTYGNLNPTDVLDHEDLLWLDGKDEEELHLFVETPLSDSFLQKAIQGWPMFGLATAVREYFDEEVPEHLSSGQSRLLSIFSGLAEFPEGSVVMIDEPELSLHIDWQESLISNLIRYFPHLKFIIATHSPNVIIEHTQKVIEVPPRDIA